MTVLCVNIDHVATLRQARGGCEPDVLQAARLVERAGAHGITVHLREDRRHIQDDDVARLRRQVKTKLNLEMAAVEEIIGIALTVAPDQVTLVPEKRRELTTEGGLDIVRQKNKLRKVVERFHSQNIPVSFFIDPDLIQVRASAQAGSDTVELHTGLYVNAETKEKKQRELERLKQAASAALTLGLNLNAGHGLNYTNVRPVARISGMQELNIGHSIISRAVFAGLEPAVKEMLALINS